MHSGKDTHKATPETTAAHTLVERRRLLQRGMGGVLALTAGSLAPAVATAAGGVDDRELDLPPSTREPGGAFTNYGQPAPRERGIVRWISANPDVPGNGVSWCPLHELEGIVVPNGLHFERHHNGVPDIDPAAHRLLIHGLVARALAFSVADLLRYPMVSRLCFIECGGNSNALWHTDPVQSPAGYAHGLASCSEWTGVPLSLVLTEAGAGPDAAWLVAEGGDAVSMNVSVPLAHARDEAILALYQNGERLRPENGYPLRLVVPGCEGILNVKWLRRLEVTAGPAMTRNETARYTELLPSGQARMFTFVMDAKSLITHPCAGSVLPAHGLYEIKGLAWSGRGRIRTVEVSTNGGATWAAATLDAPVLPKCFTRFRLPWRWDGQPAVIESRATDETGYVQPERTALVAERGRQGYYHYNGIVAWEIDTAGAVRHVYT